MSLPTQNASSIAFPWSSTQNLSERLNADELKLSTAISQIGLVLRETLRVVEEFANVKMEEFLHCKDKMGKMEKLIDDLSEKCQGMQQALLYKEEKYDEKCREVERYKVICEISAKAACSDDIYYNRRDVNDNFVGLMRQEGQMHHDKQNDPDMSTRPSSPVKRRNMSHTKITSNQMHLSSYVDPFKLDDDNDADDPTTGDINYGQEIADERIRQEKLASHYLGGPCKRKQPTQDETLRACQDLRVLDRFSVMGSVNAKGPTINSGVVPTNQLFKPASSCLTQDPNRSVKIALVGQSNEVMSSARNAASKIKQKFTEKDLHRQVAAGYWSRMPGRRKKGWPY